jgi:hypothetical protein
MKIFFGVLCYMLVITGVRAQEKIGVIYNDTAYIMLSAANYDLLKAQLESYNLTEADLIELPGRVSPSATFKWVNSYKILQHEACRDCEPVYHSVGKSEGLFRIGKWYGNQSVANLKRLNGLRSEHLTQGQKLLVGFCKIVVQAPKYNIESGVTLAVDTAETTPFQPVAKDGFGLQPRPMAPEMPDDPELTYHGNGFFEPEWKDGPAQKQQIGKAAIFKSAVGWQDGKFYLLASFLTPGTIVKLENPANGKYIVAKVLAPLPEIKINEGLICRLNDAAAALLGCLHQKTFELVITPSN